MSIDDVELLRIVGRGAYAVVYEATFRSAGGGLSTLSRSGVAGARLAVQRKRVAVKKLVWNEASGPNEQRLSDVEPAMGDISTEHAPPSAHFRRVFDEFRREAWLLSGMRAPIGWRL